MADHIGDAGDDIGIDGIVVPDRPLTALAFRTWRLGDNGRLLSINAPSLTGKAGGSANQGIKKVSWIHRHLADAEGQDGWPIGDPLVAHCGMGRAESPGIVPPANAPAGAKDSGHGPIPSKNCSCGIYATTSIKVIDQYLGTEVIMGTIAIRGQVLGVVELGGRVIPATQGYRAASARVAAIIAIDEAFTLSHSQLRIIAEFYQVPLLDDMYKDPEEYRKHLGDMPAVTDPSGVGDEADEFLKSLLDENDEEGDEE